MALLQDLIKQVNDPALRQRIEEEVQKLSKQKKFGLVFEDHLPECTPLYDMPIKRGSKVALKNGKVSDIWEVRSLDDATATCVHKINREEKAFLLSDLVVVADFGEPIYPYLKPVDSLCNAPDSDLWHTLIEADNYHALQLLEYLYAGKVDCIYIDPPYNKGARDWKYNNDYVDSADAYRHSKWLSFMEKRLKLAKKLLNPEDSVLIVTIDEQEYLHLGCLLEEMFPETKIQMVSSVINPKGSARDYGFSRAEEYIFFCFLGNSSISPTKDDMLRGTVEGKEVRWASLQRSGSDSRRYECPNMFYPIFFNEADDTFHSTGDSLPLDKNRDEIALPKGTYVAFPLGRNSDERRWQLSQSTFEERLKLGYVKFGTINKTKKTRVIYYLSNGIIDQIKKGEIKIIGHNEDGSVDLNTVQSVRPLSVWNKGSHSASEYGSSLTRDILPDRNFPFPKSVYAVKDTLEFFVTNKPNALLLDFFAGSGTTLHAVNLLNAEDGGHRRCIMVTNNEVSDAEAKSRTKEGYKPGDPEWEKLGIARYVTWPRTVCSILGKDTNGKNLEGNYGVETEAYEEIEADVFDPDSGKRIRKKAYQKVKKPSYPELSKIKKADGFQANVAYFKLGFLDKHAVALGRQFKELLPVLWMKADAIGTCPTIKTEELPKMLVLPENKFAVLIDETYYAEFDAALQKQPDIQTIYIVTDSETAYKKMTQSYEDRECVQLYRDYLDNFRINMGRIR